MLNTKVTRIFSTIILVTLLICNVTTSIFAADNEQYKTKFKDVKEINLYNDKEQNGLIIVEDKETENKLFTANPCYHYVYTTVRLNLRTMPIVSEETWVCTLDKNTKVLCVGTTKIGWSIVQIDKVNYFVWSEYLSKKSIEGLKIQEPNVAGVDEKTETATSFSTQSTSEESESSNESSAEAASAQYLGTYKLTAYCSCSICCGSYANGITASGTTATAGRTIACDLPFGTKVSINGHVYTVEDRGVSGNWIDIYFDSHSEALNFGVQYADVYIVS